MRTPQFLRFFLFLIALPGLVLACNAAILLPTVQAPIAASAIPAASQVPTISAITPTDCATGNCAGACLDRLKSIQQSSGSSDTRPKAAGQNPRGDRDIVLATYPLNGDTLGSPQFSPRVQPSLRGLQHDTAGQQRIWDYFAAIIPSDQRTELAYFILATDGKDGMLASVEQFSGRGENWALVVDPADAGEPRDLTLTLLHEFGHLLTLNSSQVKPDQVVLENPDDLRVYQEQAATCPRYFATGGCSRPGSYINQFYNLFWKNLFDEWSKVNAARKDPDYFKLMAHFYGEHASQFITPYASTSPEEDMAETWAYFILNPMPEADTVAHKKVLFYYGFPELVALRDQIAAGICSYAGTH